jgi:hypothetical protein
MVLAFLVSLVIVVLMSERKREPGGKDRWAKEGSQQDRKGMGRKSWVMVGRSSFGSC